MRSGQPIAWGVYLLRAVNSDVSSVELTRSVPSTCCFGWVSLTLSHVMIICVLSFCVPSQNWEQLWEGDRADVTRLSVR